MEDFKQRLIDEHKELEDRLNKLEQFTISTAFDNLTFEEKHFLLAQKGCMHGYYEILTMRLHMYGLLEGNDANQVH